MVLVHLALQTGGVHAKDADAQTLVLGDVFGQAVERDVGAPLLQQFAVVVGIERIDEAHLAKGDAVRRGPSSRWAVHHRQGVAAADGVVQPFRDLDLSEGLLVERLLHYLLAPDAAAFLLGKGRGSRRERQHRQQQKVKRFLHCESGEGC